MKDKEKLVRDLVDTFKDRSELHTAYKQKMKDIILHAVGYLSAHLGDDNVDIKKIIDKFIEETFRPIE